VLLESVSSQVLTLLERFHRLGITVALDDFGTGFGSLAHLKRFPIDRLKIDKSFVRDLEHDTSDAAIVSAVIGLGRNLDLDVIAEGVETEAQAEHLKMQGCVLAQGFLYAKPMVGSRVPDFLRRRQAQQRRRAARVA
jgi:EAL domain-containing protein (putative c-di-GMP-specific phosphodiesterase class I)